MNDTNTKKSRTYSLKRNGEGRYTVLMDGLTIGFLIWKEWPRAEGYWFNPMTQRQPNRVLRPTLREALIKTVKLPAKIADQAIANLREAS